jgi:hypothetical protein
MQEPSLNFFLGIVRNKGDIGGNYDLELPGAVVSILATPES